MHCSLLCMPKITKEERCRSFLNESYLRSNLESKLGPSLSSTVCISVKRSSTVPFP